MNLRRGMTVVELLVVIAIIGMLVALLLPAVQGARAVARRAQCANNQRQTALATLQHTSHQESLPALRHPRYPQLDRPISWRVTILPYLEEPALFDVFNDPDAWRMDSVEGGAAERPAFVAAYDCPESPRKQTDWRSKVVSLPSTKVLFDDVAGKNNIAPFMVAGLPSTQDHGRQYYLGVWWGAKYFLVSGESFLESAESQERAVFAGARLKYITDGLSHTVLVAEHATPGFSWIDWSGGIPGLFLLPLSVTKANGAAINGTIGQVFSYHEAGAHVALADGAVRFLNEDISSAALGALLCRDDGTSGLGTYDAIQKNVGDSR